MIPIPLEPTKKELEDKLMEMPELEQEQMEVSQEIEKKIKLENNLDDQGEELIHKRMNDINTFQAHENELYLRGTDEYGKDFQICFDSYNFLEWIDMDHLEYIKEQLTKYIKTK